MIFILLVCTCYFWLLLNVPISYYLFSRKSGERVVLQLPALPEVGDFQVTCRLKIKPIKNPELESNDIFS